MRSLPITPGASGAAILVAVAALAWNQPEQPSDPAREPAPAQPGAEPAPSSTPPAPAATPEPRAIEVGGEVELEMKDGRRISGILVEREGDRIVIAIGGLATPFDMASVAKLRLIPTVEERYESLRKLIPKDDVDGLIQLSRWLLSKGRLALALAEVDRALEADPDSQPAKDLRVIIIEQAKLESIRPAGGPDRVPVARPVRRQFPLLDDAQINLMRVLEVDLKDPPRLNIRQETVRRFLDTYAGQEAKDLGKVPVTPEGRDIFLRKPPAEILAWMFELRAREFYGEVEVLDDPRAMRLFRDSVHRNWLINSCATNRCHGGEEAGRLWLHNKQPNSKASVYTNFLIMDRFRLDDGRPLISYDSPADSILLEYGLPVKDAVRKHPEVQGDGRGRWQPVFRGRDDERYKAAIEWIRSMYRPRPDYPVDFVAPVPGGGGGGGGGGGDPQPRLDPAPRNLPAAQPAAQPPAQPDAQPAPAPPAQPGPPR
jgi:hypothetical protein